MLNTREIKMVWERSAGPEDPDSVTLNIKPPGGGTVQLLYPGTLERVSSGVYRTEYTPTAKGTHVLEWLCTYNGPPVEQGRIVDWFYAGG